MLRNLTSTLAIAAALMAGSALAQTQQQPGQASPPAGAQSSPPAAMQPSTPAPSTSAQQNQASPSAAGVKFMAQQTSDQWRGYKMVGLDVYGPNNEKVGDINEILISKDGKIEAFVVGVGGFLGIGEKNVAIPFNALQFRMESPRTASGATGGTTGTGTTGSAQQAPAAASGVREFPDHATVSLTKEQLQNAPAFRYASDTGRASGSTGSGQNPAPR